MLFKPLLIYPATTTCASNSAPIVTPLPNCYKQSQKKPLVHQSGLWSVVGFLSGVSTCFLMPTRNSVTQRCCILLPSKLIYIGQGSAFSPFPSVLPKEMILCPDDFTIIVIRHHDQGNGKHLTCLNISEDQSSWWQSKERIESLYLDLLSWGRQG